MPLYNSPAPKQAQSDWSEANSADADFIKNKPAIPSPDNGIWVGGVWKAGAVPIAVSGTVGAAGALNIDLTKTDGSAIAATEIFESSLVLRAVEGDYPLTVSSVTVAGDRKSASCTCKKASGITSLPIIGALTGALLGVPTATAAVGTVVKGTIWGR